jgi:lipopolysaccharide transport system ATP-binding protein
MSNTVISIENVSKSYQLGVINTGTFYGDLKRWWARQRGKPDPYQKIGEIDHGNREGETLWALKNVNFQVQQGEALGIIGRNGAGKSTLLKILSRVTAPTSGEIKVKGRIASLLEVGTGFHPELTGRENIFLNGAIMGMDRREIQRKFDEIVDFSGVEQFVDTPVKRYSSGMYVRLAFAVAAHLEPEILVVDEVLAVGDAEFQKKCLGKMSDVAHQGRTVLFVSHNMAAVQRLCERCIYLSSGKIVLDSDTQKTVEFYLKNTLQVNSQESPEESLQEIIKNLPPDTTFRLNSIRLTQKGQPTDGRVLNGLPLDISIDYEVLQPTVGLRVFFDLCDAERNILFRSFHDEQSDGIPKMETGRYISKVSIPADFLSPLKYELVFHAGIHKVRWIIPDGIRVAIDVASTGKFNVAYASEVNWGKLSPVLIWDTAVKTKES